jgi:CDP-glucose 4,6-dehydratase
MAQRLIHGNGDEVISIRHDNPPVSTSKIIGVDDLITWCNGSITNASFVKRVIADYGPDFVIHFAALPLVQTGTRTTIPVFETNFMGTVNILEAIKENAWAGKNIGMIYVSTDKVYGDAGNKPYVENMPLNALAIYDSSKACADIVCRTYAKCFDLNLAIVRPSNVVGVGDLNTNRVIPRTIIPCMRGEAPVLYKTPYLREFTHVEDSCEAITYLLEDMVAGKKRGYSLDHRGQAYNIGSGIQADLETVVTEVLNHFPSIKPTWVEAPKLSRLEIPFQKLNTNKIHDTLRWVPGIRDLKILVDVTVDGWKEIWSELPSYIRKREILGWHG